MHALDRPGVLEIATADPYWLTRGSSPILIDEWQLLPLSWDLVRRAVDEDRSTSRFLLTGSATPRETGTHSGAGRIVRLRMRPLSLAERVGIEPSVSLVELLRGDRRPICGGTEITLEDYVREICASGFPGLRGIDERATRAQLDSHLEQIIDRDFSDIHHTIRNPDTVRRWLAAYAASTSTTSSYESIRDAAIPGENNKPAKLTSNFYRDILQRLWILDPIPAWLPTLNHLHRLGSAPKHHLVDPALVVRLLGSDQSAFYETRVSNSHISRDANLLGQLFEWLVTLDNWVYPQAVEARVRHLRTHAGEHEIDLIIERVDGRVIAVEVKLSHSVDDRDTRHLQ